MRSMARWGKGVVFSTRVQGSVFAARNEATAPTRDGRPMYHATPRDDKPLVFISYRRADAAWLQYV